MVTMATNSSLHLARTKFQVPALPPDVLARQRLFDAIAAALKSRRLVLVSAPAGYGKTTLLAALPRACAHLPMAWLSLDEEDNDPIRFLAALVASLQSLDPGCGATVQSLLAESLAPTSRPAVGDYVRHIVGVLINEILTTLPEPFALVLDDLHRITEPAVYVALDYLLERQPSQMRLMMSARHDPPLALARLRARGQLAELRLGDLRFTPAESADWLQERLRLSLAPEQLKTLDAIAEGWAAGLRLLALSLEHLPSSAARGAFLAQMARRDRSVFDFLADEVLGQQPAAVRAFLLETSILPELTPDLCRAVTGRTDAETLLEQTAKRNLLMQALGEGSSSYRYHPLFAEFLQRRLAQETPERVAELHCRAAEAENVPARAIAHYLAAELWERAAEAIEKIGDKLVQDGLCQTLRNSIEALPVPVREARLRLLHLLGVCALHQGALADAWSLLERARSGFEASGDRAGMGEALLGLVGVASQQHDYERQAALIRQALTHSLPPHGQALLLMTRVWQFFHQGDLSQVGEDLDRALEVTLKSEDPRPFTVLAPILRMHLALLPGRAERIQAYCHQALARFGEGVGPVQASAHSLLGYLCLLCGRLDEAVQEAERARVLSQQLGGFTFLDVEVDFVLTSASLIRGDCAAAERYWEGRLPWIEDTPALKFYAVSILHLIGRAQWGAGRLDQLRQTYARMPSIVSPQELSEVKISRALMQAMSEVGSHRYAQAERILRGVIALEHEMRPWFVFGSARLLLAHVYEQWRRPKDALSELAPVLAECEREGTPGLILQEGPIVVPLLRLAVERGVHATLAAHLLSLFGVKVDPRRIDLPETDETLSPREVEVLRLVAAGASNKAITEQLFISERTAKTHVTSILRKLDVTSRTQAAARARELRIV
ncbi:MAG: AAA family ATPase [Chloroflexi bacterium]|nr:AAA family ATPase [Chloroflexota bacterium]